MLRKIAVLIMIALIAGCSQTYYSVWEKLGQEKRDLLRGNVEKARKEQGEAQEQFKDALTRLRELQNFEGGNLARLYDGLQEDYQDSAERADAVRDRIEKIDSIAKDLFVEWEREIKELENPQFKADSRKKLSQTRERYQLLHKAMVQAEQSMGPVLKQFKEYVLYLKHNLNAQAVAGLQTEVSKIEKDVDRLIKDMQVAMQKADSFIQTLK